MKVKTRFKEATVRIKEGQMTNIDLPSLIGKTVRAYFISTDGSHGILDDDWYLNITNKGSKIVNTDSEGNIYLENGEEKSDFTLLKSKQPVTEKDGELVIKGYIIDDDFLNRLDELKEQLIDALESRVNIKISMITKIRF